MSAAENSAQIGDAMLLLQQQKRELAHLTETIERVRRAYRTFASHRDRWSVDSSDPSKVYLSHPSSEERDLASYLFSQPDLAVLIAQHKAADDAVKQTTAKLAGFGIAS